MLTTDNHVSPVPFPPPLAYLVGLSAGLCIHYVLPLRILPMPNGISALRLIGATFVLLSLGLAAVATLSFRSANTTHSFRRPSTCLIVRGPFRFSRNPVYLSGALFHLGIAALVNALWPLLFFVPAVTVVHFLVAREERYLSARFGVAYEAYCKRVRRWL